MDRLLTSVAVILAVLLMGGCGGKGSPADSPTTVTAVAGDGIITVSWTMTPGVNYWVFSVPASTINCTDPILGSQVLQNASSPLALAGVNGTTYSISINGRTNGGPGGPCSTPVSATPRFAGTATPTLLAPWTAGAALGSNNLRGVTFGTEFVAVGANGVMFSSTDGTQWTPLIFAVSSNLNAVLYTGAYLAVGDGGVMLYSADAITWTPQNTGTLNNLYSIASNHVNLIVAVGANGTILISGDGKTWVAVASGTTNDLFAVTLSSGGLWLAVGAHGTLLTSSNGSAWQTVNSNTSLDLMGVTSGVSSVTGVANFVAVGVNGTLVTSPDGVTWTAQPSISANTLSAVTFGTQFIAVGANGTILTSIDGTTWAVQPSTTTNNLNAIVHATHSYSAVGAVGVNLLAQ